MLYLSINYRLDFISFSAFIAINSSYTAYLNLFLLWINPFYFKLFLLAIGAIIYIQNYLLSILVLLYFIDIKLFCLLNPIIAVDLFIYEALNPLLFNSLNKLHPLILHTVLILVVSPLVFKNLLKHCSYKFIYFIKFTNYLIMWLVLTIFMGSW